jgi:glucose-6-phosphate 1-dehydrogenase
MECIKETLQSRFMENCDIPETDYRIDSFIMIIFGGTGDLSKRKILPSLYYLFINNMVKENFYIIASGRSDYSDNDYRDLSVSSIKEFSPENYNESKCNEFAKHLYYARGNINDHEHFLQISNKIETLFDIKNRQNPNILFYLAVSPGLVPTIISQLEKINLCRNTESVKIIIEKPYGTDRESARELNKKILACFNEIQIYRIDHYLGKETVQNILFFRFANSIFEPLWNNKYIDHIQITVAESIGIESRGSFYEESGIIRDIIQNHIMQIIALIAMEVPTGFDADHVRNEKVKIFNTIRPMTDCDIKENTVMGQYGAGSVEGEKINGYREEKNVSPASLTPTYFCGKFFIDNWRWAGVPFYIRSGKRLEKRKSEIYIEFKQPPLRLFGRTCDAFKPNALIFNIQPQEEILLRMSVKKPGMGNRPEIVNMGLNYKRDLGASTAPPYERLLIDCIHGDLALFAREDGIEAMWSVVDPIIKYWEKNPPADFPNYSAGSCGPENADLLIENDGRKWNSLI